MPTLSDTETTTELALAFQPTGFEEIPGATILTRLNYYDGKFLRADDLQLEQNYLRRLAELGARAGGSGLVYGFDVFLGSGDGLTIGGGLGFDPAGRVLYLPGSFSTTLQALVDATARMSSGAFALSEGTAAFEICAGDESTTPTPTSSGAEYYLITVAHAEEACGDEEVFGKLCDDGCATSTDRAYLVEGVVVRARPYRPTTPFATSNVVQLTERHLRSLLVSAAYADEKLVVPSLISKAGLLSGPWCTGAAAPSGWEVPIAVVGVLSSSRFVDEWVVRRELMNTPPRRYWAWTMAMRPWEAYLAQILQFQCQLPSALSGPGGGATGTDPCADQRTALGEAVRYIGQLSVAVQQQPLDATMVARDVATPAAETTLSTDPGVFLTELGGISRLQDLQLRLTDIYRRVSTPSSRILVDGGIVELPPAGYLPVTPGSTIPVDEQVRRLMGEGVDLRFCVTTPDYIPHALEKAQHMDRISLIQGLDNPANKPPVDVLIPGGLIGTSVAATGWDATVALSSFLLNVGRTTVASVAVARFTQMLSFHGVGRTAPTATGAEIAIAAPGSVNVSDSASAPALSGYAGATVDVDPATLGVGGVFNVTAECALAIVPPAGSDSGAEQMQATGSARLTVVSPSQQTPSGSVMTATGTLHASGSVTGATDNSGTSSVDILVRITQTSTSPPTYEVTVTKAGETGGGGILLSATWSGTPLTVDAYADDIAAGAPGTGVSAPPATAHLVTAELIEDSDVFSASNPLNIAAHQALQALADALQDDRYTGAIADKLFDPSAQGGQASGITATQDWVLFHRRRHKDCQTTQVAPPVASKTYGVYVANTRSSRTVSQALTALANDESSIVQKLFKPAGTVTFAGGTANLTTAQQAILDAWNATNPLERIAAAVIATDETDETVSLLQSRIVAYQSAVSSVSTPNAAEPLSNRTTLSSLPSGGVDGQIVLITTVAPTICHHVYVAPLDGNAAGGLAELERGMGIDAYLSTYSANNQLIDLGEITFDDLTANVNNSALRVLADAGFLNRVSAYVIVPSADTSAAEPLSAQAQAILTTLGADTSNTTIDTAAAAGTNVEAWPTDCPVVSVFVAPLSIN